MNRAPSCLLILIAALGGFPMACARAEREAADTETLAQAAPAAPQDRPGRRMPVAPRPERLKK